MTVRVAIVMMSVGLCVSMGRAAVNSSGDVAPADPAVWTNSTNPIVGEYGLGEVTINNGSAVVARLSYLGKYSGSHGSMTVRDPGSRWTSSSHLGVGQYGVGVLSVVNGGSVSNSQGWIGNNSGSSGEVTVSDPGSTWTNYSGLYVGRSGSGVLNIANGGVVEAVRGVHVAAHPGSVGRINFDSGSLGTVGFLGSISDLSGIGTINTNGIVSDVDLVFDATHGLTQTLALNGAGQSITVNLDVNGAGPMGAGYGGGGSLRIADGVVVQSDYGYLGYKSGSTGTATVTGAGSAWINAHWLNVGYFGGHGLLDITDGGAVSNSDCLIGYRSGDSGVVTVSGADSVWTNDGFLRVGDSGSGVLNISDGGLVEVTGETHVSMDPGSDGAVNFDNGTLTTAGFLGSVSDLSGTGTINTNGLVTDVDLVFDAGGGLAQTLIINGSGRNITVNLDVDGSAPMGAGYQDAGSMHISDGLAVQSTHGYLGRQAGSTGVAIVSGDGSSWENSKTLYVGELGDGVLRITNGGTVRDPFAFIGHRLGSTGSVVVSGVGSTWTNLGRCFVGSEGSGTLHIADGGLVSVRNDLIIDDNLDGDSFVTMATGGMLALRGDGSDSLTSFLELIEGTDDIRYWDDSLWGWADITGAAEGQDYTLAYIDSGDLEGYTVLTVTTIPEPGSLAMLVLGGLALARRKRGD